MTALKARNRDPKIPFSILNEGPQDLDSIVIYRPRTSDGVHYQLAVEGSDFAQDEIEVGPLSLGHEARFVLSVGTAESLPDFRVRVECRSGRDKWKSTRLLEVIESPGAYLV